MIFDRCIWVGLAAGQLNPGAVIAAAGDALAFSSLLGFSSVFFRVGVAAGWVTRSEARHGQSTATEVSALRRALYP
jgi:hypothetical protein